MLKEKKLICQCCGREFTMSQAEIDAIWDQDITIPVFCCTKCNLRGWNPQQVRYAKYRHQMAEQTARKS